MLIVGAFPSRNIVEHGGILTSCRVLLESSLPTRMRLTLLDSSSPTVPPPPYFRRLRRALVRILSTAGRFFWGSRPDVVLLFASPGASFIEKTIIAALARLFGVKTLMFPRGGALVAQYEGSRWYAGFLRLCFRIPTLMLCQGVTYQEFFTQRVGLARDRCPVLHNWTATAALLSIGDSRSRSVEGAVVKILFLGWVELDKGIFELLECARQLAESADVPTFRIVIAGDGSARTAAMDYVNHRQLSHVVQFTGWIDGDDKLDTLRTADILVLPSYMEGMPNAVIEAMAAGLPVVATDVGAIGDLVRDGINGFVVPAKNAQQLCAALRTLVLDAGLRRTMGREGWVIAKQKFGVEGAVDRLVELANRVCK